ncbi:HD-GYP domain-containing protein [Streptomyces sp. NPDC054796]
MSRAVVAVYGAAAVLTVTALTWTLWHGLEQPGTAVVFGLVIAVGELVRVRLPGAAHGGDGDGDGSATAGPVGAAGALGYALLGEVAGQPSTHGALQCVAVAVLATLAGLAPHVALGRAPSPDHLVRGVLGVGFAATCFQPLYNTGGLTALLSPGPYHALCLLAVTLLTGVCDALLGSVLARGRTGRPFCPLLRDALRARLGIVPAIAATGAVLALGVAVAGLWALPVFCVPLLLTQFSFRRYAAVRATYRQTIASLARSTEVAGYTPHGHARRVAALSVATGRELGLSEPELTVLEYAALMHDIGQLSLVDPVAGGATEDLDPAERRRIAQLGGAVVRKTGVAADVAVVVERQADPYRDQPFTARIVRVANAYEDMVAGQPGIEGSLRALERLRLGSAHEYEPRVVEALARVVSRGSKA